MVNLKQILAEIVLGTSLFLLPIDSDARPEHSHQTHVRKHLYKGHKKPNPKSKSTPQSNIPPNHLANKQENQNLIVYYPTNDWRLYENDKEDLRTYFQKHRNDNLLIEGYCDERGSLEDNLQLGKNRAEGVAEFLRQVGYQGKPTVVSYGETKPVNPNHNKQAYKKNRRVVLIPQAPTESTNQVVKRGLKLLPADYYLIDATGSMKDGNKWASILFYRFPAGSQLYTFNSCTGLRYVEDVKVTKPDCETPLWTSLEQLIKNVMHGRTITILTDGNDNYSHHFENPASIIREANDKKIKINTIGVGQTDARYLIQIARKTGGSFYIQN